MCMSTHMSVHVFMCMSVVTSLYMYVYMSMHMSMHVHMHIVTRDQSHQSRAKNSTVHMRPTTFQDRCTSVQDRSPSLVHSASMRDRSKPKNTARPVKLARSNRRHRPTYLSACPYAHALVRHHCTHIFAQRQACVHLGASCCSLFLSISQSGCT